MKKRLLFLMMAGLCVVFLLLPGCGDNSKKSKDLAAPGSGTASSQSAASGSSSEDLNGNAQEIEKMLQGIQDDSAQISIPQSGDGAVDSLTSQINGYLNDSNDQIGSLNQATAAANKDVLANQGSGMADIVVQLGAVRTNPAAESNGKISEALKAYAETLKKKDYDGALAQLDAIIGIQNSRISAVQSALSQLQSALSSLQNLVAAAAASSASSAVSSQAA